MSREEILRKVNDYYTGKILSHGPTPNGVDWNSRESQVLRFEQLLRVVRGGGPFSLNDYGCGYGGLVDLLAERKVDFEYTGFDVSETMVAEARSRHGERPNCRFVANESDLTPADYTVASGIFNVKMDTPTEDWRDYTLGVIDRLADLSTKGFAFNVLTLYSDPEFMRPDLYYADPCLLFDYCKRKHSRWAALLHDYGLYEFTILVTKEGGTWPN